MHLTRNQPNGTPETGSSNRKALPVCHAQRKLIFQELTAELLIFG